jgi:hypothetical protein
MRCLLTIILIFFTSIIGITYLTVFITKKKDHGIHTKAKLVSLHRLKTTDPFNPENYDVIWGTPLIITNGDSLFFTNLIVDAGTIQVSNVSSFPAWTCIVCTNLTIINSGQLLADKFLWNTNTTTIVTTNAPDDGSPLSYAYLASVHGGDGGKTSTVYPGFVIPHDASGFREAGDDHEYVLTQIPGIVSTNYYTNDITHLITTNRLIINYVTNTANGIITTILTTNNVIGLYVPVPTTADTVVNNNDGYGNIYGGGGGQAGWGWHAGSDANIHGGGNGGSGIADLSSRVSGGTGGSYVSLTNSSGVFPGLLNGGAGNAANLTSITGHPACGAGGGGGVSGLSAGLMYIRVLGSLTIDSTSVIDFAGTAGGAGGDGGNAVCVSGVATDRVNGFNNNTIITTVNNQYAYGGSGGGGGGGGNGGCLIIKYDTLVQLDISPNASGGNGGVGGLGGLGQINGTLNSVCHGGDGRTSTNGLAGSITILSY